MYFNLLQEKIFHLENSYTVQGKINMGCLQGIMGGGMLGLSKELCNQCAATKKNVSTQVSAHTHIHTHTLSFPLTRIADWLINPGHTGRSITRFTQLPPNQK